MCRLWFERVQKYVAELKMEAYSLRCVGFMVMCPNWQPVSCARYPLSMISYVIPRGKGKAKGKERKGGKEERESE